jgi:maleylacetoacetate isomerase
MRWEMYSFWRSSATYRVRVALALKGLSVDERNVDLDAGGQRDPAFLAVNPMGGVPTLVEVGDASAAPLASAPPTSSPLTSSPLTSSPLTQSTAILEFLDETTPEPPLLPSDPRGRARVRSLAAMLTADTHPLVVPRVKKYLLANGFDDAAWRRWQINWFTTGLQAFEQRLVKEPGTGMFCHGDAVTIADICMASLIVVTRVFKVDVPDIPTVRAIMQRCEALPAFANSDPMKQEGAPAG